jgi:hypothetical protein
MFPIFDGITNLTRLSLHCNPIEDLSENVFDMSTREPSGIIYDKMWSSRAEFSLVQKFIRIGEFKFVNQRNQCPS